MCKCGTYITTKALIEPLKSSGWSVEKVYIVLLLLYTTPYSRCQQHVRQKCYPLCKVVWCPGTVLHFSETERLCELTSVLLDSQTLATQARDMGASAID